MPISLHLARLHAARRRALVLLAAFVLAVSASAISSSRANAWNWFASNLDPQAAAAGDSFYNMVGSSANGINGQWVGAGAHYPGGWTMYGSMATGVYYACHTYAAGNTIGPIVQNASLTVTFRVNAFNDWC